MSTNKPPRVERDAEYFQLCYDIIFGAWAHDHHHAMSSTKIYSEHWRTILTVRDKSRPYGQHRARQSNNPRTFETEV
ncbi:hypothetical protein [Hallella colorans]|uniref:hypothetical protein n=1 Tax=Hallella colorans TaxID=1703337 RepID=UPI0023F0914B|nr:hypothetical protein [Hallella colorans]